MLNRYSEGFRLALRSLLWLIAAWGAVGTVSSKASEQAPPICMTIAVAGLACSCRPIEPPTG